MKATLQWGIFVVTAAAMLTTGFQCSSSELTSARLYMNRKDYQNAQKQLEKEVEKNPKSEEGFFLLGHVRHELRDYKGMKEAYGKALALSNAHQKEINDTTLRTWGRLFNEGVDAINRAADTASYLDKAIELFHLAIIVLPESAVTYRNLGLAYMRKGDVESSISPLQHAFELSKDNMACRLLGRIYLDNGTELRSKFTEANRETFSAMKMLEGIREKMKSEDVKFALGSPTSVNKSKKKGETKEEWMYDQYNLVVSVDKDVVTAVKYSTPYNPKIDSSQYDAAGEQFRKSIEVLKKGQALYPEDAEISENLMNAYLGADETAEARVLLLERVKKFPESKFDHYNLGVFLLRDSKYEPAIEEFKRAYDLDSTFGAALYNLAAAYVNWGVSEQERIKAEKKEGDVSYKEKFKMALPFLEKVVAEKKDDVQMLELLGQVYANLNMQDKAIETYNKADAIRKSRQ